MAGGGICRILLEPQLGNLDREGTDRARSVADSVRHCDANYDRDSDCERYSDADCVGHSDRVCNSHRERDRVCDDDRYSDRDLYRCDPDCDRD